MPSVSTIAASAVLAFLSASVAAQTTTPPPSTASAAAPTITAVSECHGHGTVQFCEVGTTEYEVVGPTATEEFEAQYTSCHTHGKDTFCVNSSGDDVQILVDAAEGEEGEDDHEGVLGDAEEGQNCHFHAGTEHCVGQAAKCERQDRDYNKPLRVGLLFVILATSAIGVFSPILATRFTRMSQRSIVFVALKQFGTGVILSTAFVHLFTHATLMLTNECLGELGYEATTAAIFMAGLFLSFLVDYLGKRFMFWRSTKRNGPDTEATAAPTGDGKAVSPPNSGILATHDHHGLTDTQRDTDEKINVVVLETGIIFHSLLIGLTLVVAGDSFFVTLFVVILFHQMFEGLALGTCIAALSPTAASLGYKFLMALGFTLVTPLGMAIGIGVIDSFDGTDPSTLIAIGTLDALSAGILAWVGIHEMLARDWMHGGLLTAGTVPTCVGFFFLIAGMALMSFLGKWA